MFSVIILACTLNVSECKVVVSSELIPSREICELAMVEAVERSYDAGIRIMAIDCYNWGDPA